MCICRNGRRVPGSCDPGEPCTLESRSNDGERDSSSLRPHDGLIRGSHRRSRVPATEAGTTDASVSGVHNGNHAECLSDRVQ